MRTKGGYKYAKRAFHARLVVYDLPKMDMTTQAKLVNWLRKLADKFTRSGHAYKHEHVEYLMKDVEE